MKSNKMWLPNRIFIAIAIIGLVSSSPVKKDLKRATCAICNPIVDGKINVHLVPHSHDDAGWLKTVDQYYYGGTPSAYYANAGVQYILSSTLEALLKDPARKYIQVETAFFYKWWTKQNDKIKQQYIDLINNGQLEIINGAWTMNDEAATNYHSTIDQYTWGFRILNDTLGECARPKIGWQIDPFGHSREHASLNAQLGFRGLIIGRLDYRDKNTRIAERNLDFVWESSANLENSNIFTSMFPNFYLAEDNFNFDINYQSDPINDDIESPFYNLDEKVEQFSHIIDRFARYYKTSNILLPMGGDFTYQAAEINYSNMDRLIKGFEGNEDYNVFYSTPSCYVEAVNAEVVQNSIELATKDDDFFPYGSDDHSYWTGYFTSRPTNKRNERLGNNLLQATKQLTSFAKVNGNNLDDFLTPLREALGILQHHDAITGTEKQLVSQDYMRLLTKAIKTAEKPTGVIVGDLLKKNADDQVDLELSTCLLANVSICDTTTSDKFLVAVYNPLSRSINHYVRLPVNSVDFRITGPDGEEVYDVLDSISTFSWVNETSQPNPYDLVFSARNLPPFGLKLYYVEKIDDDTNSYKPFEDVDNGPISFGNETNGFTIDGSLGNLISVTLNGQQVNVSQELLYYLGFNGNNSNSNYRSSGAYIFRPVISEAFSIASRLESVQAVRGSLVDEVIQVYTNEVTQIIRVYKGEGDSYIEFDWLVGNLSFPDELFGKEVISRFTISGLDNNGTFYTDSNGREQIRRRRNERSDYTYDPAVEPVTGNYYPITSKIVVKDESQNLEVAVLNDRAQGGSSLTDGSVELMVHRRLPQDDNFGVAEALNEMEYGVHLYARGQHYLVFGSIDSSGGRSAAAAERGLAHRKLLAPWVWIADATREDLNSLEKLQDLVNLEFAGLTKSLPENVQILTLEPWKDDTFILRLEHTLEKDEDNALSQTVTVDLADLFTSFDIDEIVETTLGANQLLDDYENEGKLVWNNVSPTPLPKLDPDNPLQIILNPLQIRTFIIKVVRKSS